MLKRKFFYWLTISNFLYIIVLLILAGVTISALSGDNGILQNAIKSKEENKKGEIIDSARIDINSTIAEKKGENLKTSEFEQILLKYGNLSNEENIFDRTLTTEEGYQIPVIDIYNGALAEGETGDGEVTLPETDDTKPYLPGKGSTILEGTNLENRLVVIDNKNNEWVWIEVPKSIYKNNEYNNGQEITSAEGEENLKKIENALQKYTEAYKVEENYEDTYFDNCGLESKEKYNELKNKMLKSVFENGGFWIGRYEAGADTYVKSKYDKTSRTVKIQKDKFTYNYVTIAEAQNLATELTTDSSKTSSLMFGIQWRLICKYIEEKKVTTEDGQLIDYDMIKEDSLSIGNYSNSNFEITSQNAQKSTNEGESYEPIGKGETKAKGNEVLLTTGASDINKVLNIYDLAGNQFEYTLEKSEVNNATVMGSSYRAGNESIGSVNYIDTEERKDNITFRPTIF